MFKHIEEIGGSVELKDLGEQKLSDDSIIPLPPVVFAKVPSNPDPQKRTVGVYCHLDVQPAAKVMLFQFSLSIILYISISECE